MSSSSNTPPSDQDLRYPPVHIDRSLTTLNLDTLMMRSTTPREETRNTLEESNFEIVGLSDSLLDLTSDDEAHTESIASTEGPTPDDASEFSDDEEYGVVNRDLDGSMLSTQANIDGQADNLQAQLTTEDSTHTEVPAYLEHSEESHQMRLRLEEQPAEAGTVIQGSQVVRSFTKNSSPWFPVFDQYNCSEVRLVVKAGLSHETISAPDTYNIWYIGEPDRWLENKISFQIAAALTACPNTSRSVMVQGQLEPYGPIINAQWCSMFRVAKNDSGPSSLSFVFDNGKKVALGPASTLAMEDRPDLVVLNHPSTPRSEDDKQEHDYACEILQREGIPHLQLVAARCYGHGSLQYDSRSLVACVEGRKDARANFELQEVLLLDHFTFCELDPMQLNRHLALISPHLLTTQVQSGKASRSGNLWKNHVKNSPMHKFLGNKMFLMLLALASIAATFFLNPVLTSYLPTTDITKVLPRTSFSELSSPSSTINTVLAVTSQTSAVATPSVSSKSASKELTLVPSSPKVNKRKHGKCKNKVSDGFAIQATGPYQFTLRPTERLANVRNKPQLQIEVYHNSASVSVRSNRTVDGGYVVDLEHPCAFDSFNVEITSFTKPRIHEIFEVQLGHNRSSITQIFDSAKEQFGIVQGNLRRAAQGAEAGLRDMRATAESWTRKAQEVDNDALTRLAEAKDAVIRQIRLSSSVLTDVPRAVWIGARDITAPVRTSESMLRARVNALHLRCQLETAAGLSSEAPDGKRSWACSKVKEQS